MELRFPVPTECDGTLLRTFLHACAVSSDLARGVKYRGDGFFLDGVPIHTNAPVRGGAVLSFLLPPELSGPVAPQPEIGLSVVYRDAFAAVIEKPAGIAVHPTLNYPGGTLANAWSAWAPQNGLSPVFRPVNRLDKNTSGLLLAALNPYAAPFLAAHVQKTYLAVAEGEMPLGEGVFDAPIGRREGSIIGRCVTPQGKQSRTEYTVLKSAGGLSLAACRPITGRTHQIRVHFSHAGHPLLGDDLYGGHTDKLNRQALHCAEMRFSVPEYTQADDALTVTMPLRLHTVCVQSALPPELQLL